MTKDQAYAAHDSKTEYVEYYAGTWMIVPYAPVAQPQFFNCQPTSWNK